MDIHIERPTLNASTTEENIALVDTWIADTADKLNVALKSNTTALTTTETTETTQSSNGFDARYASSSMSVYLGSGRTKATKIIMEA